MRAYADTLMSALAEHAPDFATELVELDPMPARNAWAQRLQTLLMPLRARQHRHRSPDLWHVLDGSRAYVARALGSAPTVVTVHDISPWLQIKGKFSGAPAQGAAAAALWRANGREFRRATRLVCVSECTANDTLREFGGTPELARVVPLPLRPGMANRAHAASDATRCAGVVLHVGNNGFYKNREAVLRFFSGLDRGIASRLLLAGPGPTEALQRIAHELAISDRVEWVLEPDDDTLANLYRTSSVLLHPSLYEGFGWPVLEAMAFGLPVVISDTGSLREVAGDAAVCLPLSDEAGFVAAITRVLSRPDDAATLSRRGLERARDFSASVFARQMRDVYAGAIVDSRGSPA